MFKPMKAFLSCLVLLLTIASTICGDNGLTVGGRYPSAERIAQAKKAYQKEAKKDVNVDLRRFFVAPKVHPIAIQYLAGISMNSREIRLVDGSRWSLSWSQSFVVSYWQLGDPVVLMPNNSWFPSTKFQIKNLNTNEVVPVNIELGPTANGKFTKLIFAVNDFAKQIQLTDGVLWKIHDSDAWKIREWLPNDPIIIGVNNGYAKQYFPNVLINIETLETVRARTY